MSAIKRFFSSHKTSSNSKVNNSQHHENQTSQTKLSNNIAVGGEKLIVTNETVEQEEIKENMVPPTFSTTEIQIKSDSIPSPTSPEIVSSNNNEEKKST
ncbi:unnamed protein product, partial [Rotaria sp. Silwood2]